MSHLKTRRKRNRRRLDDGSEVAENIKSIPHHYRLLLDSTEYIHRFLPRRKRAADLWKSLSTQIPQNLTVGSSSAASYILLVAMDDMYVGQGTQSRGLELAISNDAYFTSAPVAIRLMYRTDIQPGHPVSIAMLTGVL